MIGELSKQELGHAVVTVGIGIVFGVGLRRWRGDAARSTVQTQLAMQIDTAIGYFLVADHDDAGDEHTGSE